MNITSKIVLESPRASVGAQPALPPFAPRTVRSPWAQAPADSRIALALGVIVLGLSGSVVAAAFAQVFLG
jgi:hypothetical protein